MYLFDRDSDEVLGSRARKVADWLGIELKAESIEPAMRAAAVYRSPAMRITSLSGVLNRALHGLYRSLSGETPFVTALRLGSPDPPGIERRRRGAGKVILDIESAFTARHIHRREVLEAVAGEKNLLLLGSANRTECLVGWFAKGGVDDLPLQPLKGLYKTQVGQLARYLRVPVEVQAQAASPDMMKGITDEFAIGMNYGAIDLALDFIGGGISRREIAEAGVTDAEIHLVERMNELSSWKRGEGGSPPPVDGGPNSPLRMKE
jgi:NAD+ synthase